MVLAHNEPPAGPAEVPLDQSFYTLTPTSTVSNQGVQLLTAIVVALAIALAVWWFFVRPHQAHQQHTGLTAAGWLSMFFREVIFMVAAAVLGTLAFIVFFADHQPYPVPFDNLRVLVAVELALVLTLDTLILRWIQRHQQRAKLPGRTEQWLMGLNSVALAATIVPLVLTLLFGD